MQALGINMLDVVAGRGPAPSYVLGVVEGLPDTSLTAALLRGGREFYGWGHDRVLMASLFDAVNLNTRATGMWEDGKAPKLPEWPRPDGLGGSKAVEEKSSVRDAWGFFSSL